MPSRYFFVIAWSDFACVFYTLIGELHDELRQDDGSSIVFVIPDLYGRLLITQEILPGRLIIAGSFSKCNTGGISGGSAKHGAGER